MTYWYGHSQAEDNIFAAAPIVDRVDISGEYVAHFKPHTIKQAIPIKETLPKIKPKQSSQVRTVSCTLHFPHPCYDGIIAIMTYPCAKLTVCQSAIFGS